MTTPENKGARETRLLDKTKFDDPDEPCPAGGILESDSIYKWPLVELVYTIQDLDEKLFVSESALTSALERIEKLREALDSVTHWESWTGPAFTHAKKVGIEALAADDELSISVENISGN